MTTQEATARRIIGRSSDQKLFDLWMTTSKAPMTPELPTVRGWLMDEIEKRYPEAFDTWLDSPLEDESLISLIQEGRP